MLIKEKVVLVKGLIKVKELYVNCWITFISETGIIGNPLLSFFVPADLTWHSATFISKDGIAHVIICKYDNQIEE